MRRFMLLLALLVLPGSAIAQTTVPLNRALTAVFTHNGVATQGYRVYLDGQKQGPDQSQTPVNGEIRLPVPAITTPGAHLLEVSAFNDIGESAKAPLQLFAGPPTAPTGPRIEITTITTGTLLANPDGTLRVEVDGVSTSVIVK
jgi:hypothetical protein